MAKVLVVDDEEQVLGLIGQILTTNGHDCALAPDAAKARQLLKKQDFDLILCDINMPGESGLHFIRYVLKEFPDTAAVMVTAMDDPLTAEVVIEAGVYDYIVKPFDSNGLIISVSNALRRRQLELDNREYRERLEKMVEERTGALQDSMQKLRSALEGSINAMAVFVEMRDPYTSGHQQRVAGLAAAMGKEMAFAEDKIEGLRMAGKIHDIGKMAVPAEILSKPGRLSKLEFDLIKIHPRVGYDILKPIEFPWPIADMVLQHHERVDGSGYPSGLKGNKILPESRILAVADVVEAMASHRPYRAALGMDRALDEITRNKGTLYAPDGVEACARLVEEKGFHFD